MKYIFFLFFSVFIQFAFAQTDSSNVILDTVYVESEPVVITETVYITDLPKEKSKQDFFIDFNINNNFFLNNLSDNQNKVNFQNSYSFNLNIGKSFNKISLKVGLGLTSTQIQQTLQSKYDYNGYRSSQIIDTIDVYYQIVNSVNTPIYVTQLLNKIEPFSSKKDTIIVLNNVLRFIDIPVFTSYLITKGKFVLEPSLGFVTSFLISSSYNNEANLLTFNHFIKGSAGLSLLYKITEKFALGAQYQLQRNLTNMIKNETFKTSSSQYGLSLKYLF